MHMGSGGEESGHLPQHNIMIFTWVFRHMQESCNWITNWVATPALSTEEGSDKQSELFHNPYFRNQLCYSQNRLHTYFKTMFNLICLFSKPSLPTTFVGRVSPSVLEQL